MPAGSPGYLNFDPLPSTLRAAYWFNCRLALNISLCKPMSNNSYTPMARQTCFSSNSQKIKSNILRTPVVKSVESRARVLPLLRSNWNTQCTECSWAVALTWTFSLRSVASLSGCVEALNSSSTTLMPVVLVDVYSRVLRPFLTDRPLLCALPPPRRLVMATCTNKVVLGRNSPVRDCRGTWR